MTPNKMLMYAVFVLCGILAVCFIVNLLVVGKKGKGSKWCLRGIYISGILIAILNGARMFLLHNNTMGFANVIVLICIVAAFVRAEKGPTEEEEE